MKNKTCCFTGHRKIPPEQLPLIARRLEDAVIELINNGYLYFGAGGALGFDTLAAQTVLKLKKQHPKIRLILVLPCLSQTKGWSQNNIAIYDDIKRQADKVVYTSEQYTSGCMLKRNRHLVDCSSVCICYLRKDSGGTVYTVDYAKKNNLQLIYI